MSEIFHCPPLTEESPPHELTPQGQYVAELAEYAESLPDFSSLPPYFYPSSQDSYLLGGYCRPEPYYHTPELAALGVPLLFRADIIDPSFCRSIDQILRKIAGNSPFTEWYAISGTENTNSKNTPPAKATSRRWELFFVGYLRQRRLFHAAFMHSLLTSSSMDDTLAGIGHKDGQPIETPATDPYQGRPRPAPEFMYNKTNWLTASLWSALALPPDQCNAPMKRRAIEQWASYVDLQDAEGLSGFPIKDHAHLLRLPWSMRSNNDLHQTVHPHWRQNRIILTYLGEERRPRADGLVTLLQERPKDYIQVLLLHAADTFHSKAGLHALAQAATLPQEVKDIIFAEDAAHNTIYTQNAFSESMTPPTLIELLSGRAESTAPQTQETIIANQRLRIHVLNEELERVKESAAAQDKRIQSLQDHVHHLQDKIIELTKTNSAARSPDDELMLKFGISPGISNEMLLVLTAAIRRDAARKLHTDSGPRTQEEVEELKLVNTQIDNILKSRGLQKNQG